VAASQRCEILKNNMMCLLLDNNYNGFYFILLVKPFLWSEFFMCTHAVILALCIHVLSWCYYVYSVVMVIICIQCCHGYTKYTMLSWWY